LGRYDAEITDKEKQKSLEWNNLERTGVIRTQGN
jgi:hypothetical protein